MTSVPDDLPDVGELLEGVERLDADNERLRMKALDLMRAMEDVVSDQVAGERRITELEEQNRRLEAELALVRHTKLMRFARRSSTRTARFGVGRTGRRSTMVEQYPVFIPVRDRVTTLRLLVEWLERAGRPRDLAHRQRLWIRAVGRVPPYYAAPCGSLRAQPWTPLAMADGHRSA